MSAILIESWIDRKPMNVILYVFGKLFLINNEIKKLKKDDEVIILGHRDLAF